MCNFINKTNEKKKFNKLFYKHVIDNLIKYHVYSKPIPEQPTHSLFILS